MPDKYKYINLAYVDEVSGGDPETKKQLIDVFFEQIEGIKKSFDTALQAHNGDEIRKTAHLAKSTLKVMGINDLSDKMLQLEQQLKANPDTECSNYIEEFNTNINLAIAELKMVLKTL